MAYSARESWLGRHLLELLLTAVATLILLWLGGKLDATAAFPHLALRYSDLANSSASRALFLNTTAGHLPDVAGNFRLVRAFCWPTADLHHSATGADCGHLDTRFRYRKALCN